MMHHPVFDRVPGHIGARREGHTLDYVGAVFRCEWGAVPHQSAAGPFQIPRPVFDEEYFEMVDILESVEAAGDRYVMMELGAGFGRWGVRAGLAARSRGIQNIQLVFVEGLPKHVRWLGEAISLNGLTDVSVIHPKAIAYDGKPVPFMAESVRDGADWMGQGRAFQGAEQHGYGIIPIDPITLEETTQGLDRIDLIDMDLQGAEREVIQNSMPTLNAKVKRLHIGTHGHEIEVELRKAFMDAGWRNMWDYPCARTNETPYGSIGFVDGVQGWINPRIA